MAITAQWQLASPVVVVVVVGGGEALFAIKRKRG